MGKGSLGKSFNYAIAGILYALTRERNMRIHVLAACAAVALGLYVDLSRMEWGLLTITITLVIVIEMVNTAVEKTVDMMTGGKYHPLAKAAKNVAAGAVLLSAINALVMAYIIFVPHLR
ncbi:MAG: diacylglycerol kinase family protein [Syntrophomonadaceae bacterium]|jgi:diacylglycerol kinase|nr:diacylglycerol kinase family protein [Bacillota bacterium]NLM88237.1 diacylglycerol kinase family protein [Syntrophomonadaceae bacterium]HAA08257.1 diacylglycerol kinase [Syntrophomonas sp.]HQA50701.1 diacylglycerol kinase family protein [Syntrophomonadaceae bacterium]HQD89835.1 diacylglycerol kinase family protein [Syntrophomonadaceae bacterium]